MGRDDINVRKKLKHILSYIGSEINKPNDNYNYETRIWIKGYKKAMETIKNLIFNIINKDG